MYVAVMGEIKNAYTILVRKPMSDNRNSVVRLMFIWIYM